MADRKIPGCVGRVFFNERGWLSPPAVHHVVPGCLVAATEAFAVVCPGAFGNVRMAVLVAIVDVGSAMVVVVFTGTLDAVVISPLLDLAKFLRGHIPVPVAVMVVVLVLKCRSWRSQRLGHGKAGR